jgi:hypothetical protein
VRGLGLPALDSLTSFCTLFWLFWGAKKRGLFWGPRKKSPLAERSPPLRSEVRCLEGPRRLELVSSPRSVGERQSRPEGRLSWPPPQKMPKWQPLVPVSSWFPSSRLGTLPREAPASPLQTGARPTRHADHAIRSRASRTCVSKRDPPSSAPLWYQRLVHRS